MIVVLAGTGGDVMVTRVMKRLARGKVWSWRMAPGLIGRAAIQPDLYIGVGLMAVAFFSLITVLSWAAVSLVIPATAANHIVGPLAAKVFLKERVTKARWLGVLLVTAGVLLVFASQS